ncbi:MAG: hypothetical protein FJ128_13025 [Deltaproteobacteria bacterium]|nr:hypothetical protein [Deltaproteobacteria bacterium]
MVRFFALLVLATACCFAAPPLAQATPPPVLGIYDLLPTNSLPDTPELANPEVAGLSARFRWDSIEAKENVYTWTMVDQAVARAQASGKKVILRVVAGMHTPAWVYKKGAKYVRIALIYKMPIVWDPIYLQHWCDFINAFAQRYKDNPHVLSIQMTGVGKYGEMGINFPGLDWTKYGYTDDKYVNAWKTVIDAYRQAFPDKVTHLCIHKPFAQKYDVMMRVVNYCLSTYPYKVYIQANDLKEAGSEYSAYIRQAAASTKVGYQMYGGREWDDEAMGDRQIAFEKGLADGIVYAEVYQGDLQDEHLAAAVSFLAAGLEADAGP